MKEMRVLSKDEPRSEKDCFQDYKDLSQSVNIEDGSRAKVRITG